MAKHKEESKNITLKLGNVSWDKELGPYYIDFSPSIVHYTQNIYGGKFDDKKVPMVSTVNGLEYSPVNIAQYGLLVHTKYCRDGDSKDLKTLEACVDRLLEMKTEYHSTIVWWQNFDSIKYKLKAPWASAMSQGEIISLFLRVYQINQNEKLLKTCLSAYSFLKLKHDKKGVRVRDEKGFLWLEEYPSKPHSFVLNGFIYAVLGLVDLYRVAPSEELKRDIDDCLLTLEKNVSRFDAGYWSYYDLHKKELVRYYYQKNVHVPQLKVLFQLTKKRVFFRFAEKWSNQIRPTNYIFVQIMYRVLPRLRKFRKLWKN